MPKIIEKHNFLTDEKSIVFWLKKHSIKDYQLIKSQEYGFVVNTKDVDLANHRLDAIAVKFNKCSGSFFIENNNLTSLAGSPHTITGHFDCGFNQLKNLKGGPKLVAGIFSCNNNRLTSLKGGPEFRVRSYYCEKNKLTSLEGIPDYIVENLDFSHNKIKSALFCPKKVGANFGMEKNPISSNTDDDYVGTDIDDEVDYIVEDFNFFYTLHQEEIIKDEKNKLNLGLALTPLKKANTRFKL